MLPPAEFAALAEDIKVNGVMEPVTLWTRPDGRLELLDGRNRLDAAEAAGFATVDEAGTLLGGQWLKYRGDDPAAAVVGLNIRRRHLTKRQQADLVIRAVQAAAGETPDSLAGVSRGSRGPAKDPVKAKSVQLAAQMGIGERTVERALAARRAAAEPIAGQLDLLTGKEARPGRRGRSPWRGLELLARIERFESLPPEAMTR
jgi:hypothetical protein